jgi:hypothetical protein
MKMFRQWSMPVVRLHNPGLGIDKLAFLLALVSIGGCSELGVLLGVRTRLDKLPVTSISASLVGTTQSGETHTGSITALAPGGSARLVIVATTQDGKQLVTAGAGKGTVLLDSYVFTASLATIGKRGKVSLPADPRITDGKVPNIHIATVGHPDVVADLDIGLRYDVPFLANLSGAGGADGFDGINGSDGLSGSDAMPGSIDPVTGLPGPQGSGGNGSNGGHGGDGGNGWDGKPGAAVQVWLRLEPGPGNLLQAKVTGGPREMYYLIDAKGGSLKVTADGGAGGSGGTGGRAGRGGSGGSGNPNGFSGVDGFAGADGLRGNGGAAGTIAVSVDPAAQPFEGVLILSNRSGSGQQGPSPAFTITPVSPLW